MVKILDGKKYDQEFLKRGEKPNVLAAPNRRNTIMS